MIKLGEMQDLVIDSLSEEMIILSPAPQADSDKDQIDGPIDSPIDAPLARPKVFVDPALAENKDKVQGLTLGQAVQVFVDKDKDGVLWGSLSRPHLLMGEIKACRVVDVTDLGIFLDWGLSHDLFLPHKNHRETLGMKDRPLVTLTINPKGRVTATTEIYQTLKTFGPFEMGDIVLGTVYDYSQDLKAYLVALEGGYQAMIPQDEAAHLDLAIPSTHRLRVKRVRVDGKCDVTPRKKAYQERGEDADRLLAYMKEQGGRTDLHDKSQPEAIKKALSMSKAAFKRAAGKLYKEGIIKICKDGMTLIPDEKRDDEKNADEKRAKDHD